MQGFSREAVVRDMLGLAILGLAFLVTAYLW